MFSAAGVTTRVNRDGEDKRWGLYLYDLTGILIMTFQSCLLTIIVQQPSIFVPSTQSFFALILRCWRRRCFLDIWCSSRRNICLQVEGWRENVAYFIFTSDTGTELFDEASGSYSFFCFSTLV